MARTKISQREKDGFKGLRETVIIMKLKQYFNFTIVIGTAVSDFFVFLAQKLKLNGENSLTMLC